MALKLLYCSKERRDAPYLRGEAHQDDRDAEKNLLSEKCIAKRMALR
jgi:hypothetical protein